MKVEYEKIIFVIEQKMYEIEDEKVRYGMYSPLLEAQTDLLHDLMRDVEEMFKYNEVVVDKDAIDKKVSKRGRRKS